MGKAFVLMEFTSVLIKFELQLIFSFSFCTMLLYYTISFKKKKKSQVASYKERKTVGCLVFYVNFHGIAWNGSDSQSSVLFTFSTVHFWVMYRIVALSHQNKITFKLWHIKTGNNFGYFRTIFNKRPFKIPVRDSYINHDVEHWFYHKLIFCRKYNVAH